MRVYSDQTLNALYVEGVSSGPVADFQFSYSGTLISAYRPSTQLYDFALLPFDQIQDERGQTFQSVDSAMSYLNALTVPSFPLHFTTRYPLVLDRDVVEVDDQFLNQFVYMIDGGNA